MPKVLWYYTKAAALGVLLLRRRSCYGDGSIVNVAAAVVAVAAAVVAVAAAVVAVAVVAVAAAEVAVAAAVVAVAVEEPGGGDSTEHRRLQARACPGFARAGNPPTCTHDVETN